MFTGKAQRIHSTASIFVLYSLSGQVGGRAGVTVLSTPTTPLGWYYILEHAASLRARYFECRFCHLWIYLASVTQHGRCSRPHRQMNSIPLTSAKSESFRSQCKHRISLHSTAWKQGIINRYNVEEFSFTTHESKNNGQSTRANDPRMGLHTNGRSASVGNNC